MARRPGSFLLLALFLGLLIGCQPGAGRHGGTFEPDRVFTAEELREDLDELRDAMEEMHPALYAFTDEATFDALFAASVDEIDRPMGYEEFYRVAAPLVTQIGCGHTKLTTPEGYWEVSPRKLFPLELTFPGAAARVLRDNGGASAVPPGAEVVAIDGRAITEIADALKRYIPADGYNESSRTYHLAAKFPFLYALVYGYTEEFEVGYREPGGTEILNAALKPVSPDTILEARDDNDGEDDTNDPDLRFEILEERETAVLTIRSFGYYDHRDAFYSFIDDAFERIDERRIGNLVLDLRGNDGGDPFCTTHLLAYISPRTVPYFGETYWEYARFARPIPLAEKRFRGRLFVLIDGGGFSSTGHLCAVLWYHGIGVLVGSETGGTYTCNDASKTIELGNTGFRFNSARRTFRAAVAGLPRDRGILPDHPVDPTIDDLLAGRDRVLDYTLRLIDR